MASVNLMIISGRLLSSPKGMKDAVSFKLLWSEPRKDGPEDRCEIEVITFGELASKCADLKQGDFVECEGRLNHRKEELAGKTKYYSQLKASKVHAIEIRHRPIASKEETTDSWDVDL